MAATRNYEQLRALYISSIEQRFCEFQLAVTQESCSTSSQSCIHLTTTGETMGLATHIAPLRRRKRGGPCAMQGENKALVRIRIRPHSLSSGQSISVTFMFSTRWTASLGGHHIVQPRRYYTRYRVNYVRCFTM